VVAGSLAYGAKIIERFISFLLGSYYLVYQKKLALTFIFPLDRVIKELYN